MTLIETPPGTETGWVDVTGTPIRWYGWGEGAPAALLLHGGGANSSWWFDTIAALGPRQRVVAMDFSGHGDSGRRDEYSVSLWADEAEAVLTEVIGVSAVVIAHSMGGRAAVLLAARRPDRVRGLVLLDSVLPTHADEPVPRPSGKRVYPTLADAVTRFRLVPGTSATGPDVLERLARASIGEADGGYTWKFDPRVFSMPDAALVNASIAEIQCPVVMVHAVDSPVTEPRMASAFASLLGRDVDFRLMPGVNHHVMVDEPARTAALLDSLPLLAAASVRAS